MTVLTYRGVGYNKEERQATIWQQMLEKSMRIFKYRNHLYAGKTVR